jgi:mannose-6-phosphate isomerase
MIELDGPIRPYAWGSRSFLATLQGRPVPAPDPEAELWLGAHPDAPALADGVPLGELISADPAGMLGPEVLDRYGVRLPYILKVLAAERALSIQVHPDAAQARVGFERGSSNYTDPHPKPELLVAITPFEGLCGFRDPATTADELAELGVPALKPVVEMLRTGDVGDRLREALATLLAWPAATRAELVGAVAASGHPLAALLAGDYPGDIGVVVALLLNHVRLAPGEAIFMPAGNVHAYIRGAGVEILGASDNVVRAGLTAKPVEPDELMRLVRYEVLADPVYPATSLGVGLTEWAPPVDEFRLIRGTGGTTLPGEGPRIVVCLRGNASLRSGAATVALPPGAAVFLGADEPAVEVTGDAEVFQACPGAC